MTRLDELLADRTLWGLDPAEELELARLAPKDQAEQEAEWDRAAAAAMLALDNPVPSTPSPALMARLRAAAPVQLPGVTHPPPRPLTMTGHRPAASRADQTPGSGLTWVSSFVAAASLTLAAILWADRPPTPQPVQAVYQNLLQSTEASRWDWSKGSSPLSGNPGGELVWSDKSQSGVMRFQDLPPTPEGKVYQLWIVDAQRQDDHPVDGGVFEITPGQREALVPIDPKLKVSRASKFIITLEPEGGVVVSKLGHVIAHAQPK